MAKKTFIILPHQLFSIEKIKHFDEAHIDEVHIVEHPYYFTRLKFHKLKLAFHVASMKEYADRITFAKVKYINFYNYDNWKKIITNIVMFDPVDRDVVAEFKKMGAEIIESDMFLIKAADLKNITYKRHNVFYKFSREYIRDNYGLDYTELDNMDKFNRGSMTKEQIQSFVEISPKYKSKHYTKAIIYVNNYFKNNFGYLDMDNLSELPVTHRDAINHMKLFFSTYYDMFGPYQDFISKNHYKLNHAHISFLLNINLLTPLQVLKEMELHNVPIQSIEAFIRQLVGWREYMRYLYITYYEELISSNFWNNHRPLDYKKTYGEKPFNIEILDNELTKLKRYGWTHHIIRLAVFLNYFIMTEVHPHHVLKWFQEIIALDSYDWVMVSNIMAMGYYSNKFMSKPYFMSGNYLKKMSNYHIENVWTDMYYKFIDRKKSLTFYRPFVAASRKP